MPSLAGFLAEAARQFEQLRPILPLYVHLILSALFPIVTGSYASLSRPSSAAKPSKKKFRQKDDGEEDEEVVQKMEGLTPRDAVIFPVTAGTVLAGLYWLIKRYGADAINLVLGWYFSIAGLLSVSKSFNDVAVLGISLVFPTYFRKRGKAWRVNDRDGKVTSLGEGQQDGKSPLPGRLNDIVLPSAVERVLWFLRSTPKQKYDVSTYVRHILDLKFNFTLVNLLSVIAGLAAISYNHFVAKPWWLTNLQGFAVSYSTLQFMSPTSFTTGSLILSGLFFYDIWAVFFTPLMVTVAKNLDQPIKLLFPRPDEPAVQGMPPPPKSYSMLGLGDIVLPGLMIGLALRFDLYMFYLRKQQKNAAKAGETGESKEEVVKAEYSTATGHWGSRLWTLGLPASCLPAPLTAAAFPKPYFTASLVGYVIGMLATLGVMTVWQHAQPALLYLVPGVLLSLWGTAAARGELKEMWNFSEIEEEDEEEKKKREEEEEKEKKEAEEKKAKVKKDGREDESWYASWKRYLIGSTRDSSHSDNKEGDEKVTKEGKSEGSSRSDKEAEVHCKDPVKTKADQDPDHILSFSIRRHIPSNAALKEDKKCSAGMDKDAAAEKALAEAEATDRRAKSESSSGSEDAVLVSNDSEIDAADGPARRTRGKGRATNNKKL